MKKFHNGGVAKKIAKKIGIISLAAVLSGANPVTAKDINTNSMTTVSHGMNEQGIINYQKMH